MSALGSTPSLATATSTRLDSACKHIQQCRVSQDHMTVFADKDADELIRNKYRYCVHKDEMVVGITRPLGSDNKTKRFQISAYPRVVSNLGKMLERKGGVVPEAEKVLKLLYHYSRSLTQRDTILRLLQEGDPGKFPAFAPGEEPYLPTDTSVNKLKCSAVMQDLFDLVPVGYANTLGWAHAHCGDTMSSVMIGGLRTVRNGAFEVFTGDILQWYWPFEQDCFEQNGRRKPAYKPDTANGEQVTTGLQYSLQKDPGQTGGPGWDAGGDAALRQNFRDRQYGQKRGVEKAVPMLKPYLATGEDDSIYDWHRVFARALAPARAFDEVDIMIFRQAL